MVVKKIGILGAGPFGTWLTQTAVQAGVQVVLRDIHQKFVEKALKAVTEDWENSVKKGILSEEVIVKYSNNIILGNCKRAFHNCELIIETASEEIEQKKQFIKILDGICVPETVITTQLCGFTIDTLASVSERPHKLVGINFANSTPPIEFVELVLGAQTTEETIQMVKNTFQQLGVKCS